MIIIYFSVSFSYVKTVYTSVATLITLFFNLDGLKVSLSLSNLIPVKVYQIVGEHCHLLMYLM